MAEIKTLYGTTQTLTITGLSTLASAANGISDSVSNLINNHLDVFVFLSVTTGSGSVATGLVEVYAKSSLDNVNFDDDYNDKWIGTLSVGVAGAQTRFRGVSVSSGFQGTMPPYWKIRVKNSTGAAFTNASVTYQGVSGQSV